MNPGAIFVGCCLLVASAAVARAEIGAEGRRAPSCGEWIVHREKSDTLALGNTSWLLGYLSGLAASGGKEYLLGTDNASIYKWMDKYCRANPLRDLSDGGNALAAELAKNRAIPK